LEKELLNKTINSNNGLLGLLHPVENE